MNSFQDSSLRWLHVHATLVACGTFLLIVAGALVTSNAAGLSVPDWPTSFGSFRMPPMVGGVLYEHGHRMIAGTVGILTILLAIWIWLREPRRSVRWLGAAAVLAVILQAVLGGVTVLLKLPPIVSIGHATLGQAFFAVAVSLALFTGEGWHGGEKKWEDNLSPSLRRLALGLTAATFVQLVLGAAFRHDAFGIPPHVVGAGVVSLLLVWVVTRVLLEFPGNPRLIGPARILLFLLAVQLLLGLAAYHALGTSPGSARLLPVAIGITTAHVAIGALILATSLVLTFEAYRLTLVGRRAAAFDAATPKAAS
jgi:cytochrome c oxidase assembly protein subunit 15